jgi:hypothetical protein
MGLTARSEGAQMEARFLFLTSHINIWLYVHMKEIERTLKLLSDPTRLRILMLLSRRELCVCQVMGIIGVESGKTCFLLPQPEDALRCEEDHWLAERGPENRLRCDGRSGIPAGVRRISEEDREM